METFKWQPDKLPKNENSESTQERIKAVFFDNPELASTGTPEEYEKYLESIFPESKVQEILFHNSNNKFDKFDRDIEYYKQERNKNRAFYFSNNKDFWKRNHTYAAKLNIEKIADKQLANNPEFIKVIDGLRDKGFEIGFETLITTDIVLAEIERGSPYVFEIPEIAEFLRKNNFAYTTPEGGSTYAVFEEEQIHLLGSEKDIEGFRKFKMPIWAEELDALQRAAPKANGEETIEYVNWIVQDLRDGKWDTAKANYNNQSDKYSKWKDIKAFLLKIGVAEEIDWSKYQKQED